MNYNDIQDVLSAVKDDQAPQENLRGRANEAHNFLEKRDGQWEPEVVRRIGRRPRYTFDRCNPIVDGIVSEIIGADFDIRVRPGGGEASKDTARLTDGLIRNIETTSNSSHIYGGVAQDMVSAGIGGCEIVVDWIDGDSFEQDFILKPIRDFENRVWYDSGSIAQDASDANHVTILDNLTRDEYEKRFPDGSFLSVGDTRTSDVYYEKPDFIKIGRIIYREEYTQELVLMTDGSVYKYDEKFKAVQDEKLGRGIEIERRRSKKSYKVYSRIFDGRDFLTDPEETVFKGLPVVPCYANFNVREGKVIYYGAIEHILDAQRTYNYIRSREVEDIALSAPDVVWASRKQLQNESDRASVENMNRSTQRVMTYTPDPENPGPPQRSGPPSSSPGIQTLVQNTALDIQASSARSALQNGDIGTKMLSGEAISLLQNKADSGTLKYFKSMEVFITRLARILVDAMPNLYDSTSIKRIIGEGGEIEMVSLNKPEVDTQTGKTYYLNDLSQGYFDVVCDVGQAFKNRQQEAVSALSELSSSVPMVGELSADIILKNINSPGVDMVAERVRSQMVQSGMIPEEQLTNEEKQKLAQMQAQPQEPRPEDEIAQAELQKAQAEAADVQARAILKSRELDIKEQEGLLKAQSDVERLQLEELKTMMQSQSAQVEQQNKVIEANLKGQAQMYEVLNMQADTLNKLKDAIGVDAVLGPDNMKAYKQQAEMITEQQEQL